MENNEEEIRRVQDDIARLEDELSRARSEMMFSDWSGQAFAERQADQINIQNQIQNLRDRLVELQGQEPQNQEEQIQDLETIIPPTMDEQLGVNNPFDDGDETFEPIVEEESEQQADEQPPYEVTVGSDGQPVVEESSFEEPVVEQPVSEESIAEQSAIDSSAFEQPVAEDPEVQEPVADQSTFEGQITEQPALEQPMGAEQSIEQVENLANGAYELPEENQHKQIENTTYLEAVVEKVDTPMVDVVEHPQVEKPKVEQLVLSVADIKAEIGRLKKEVEEDKQTVRTKWASAIEQGATENGMRLREENRVIAQGIIEKNNRIAELQKQLELAGENPEVDSNIPKNNPTVSQQVTSTPVGATTIQPESNNPSQPTVEESQTITEEPTTTENSDDIARKIAKFQQECDDLAKSYERAQKENQAEEANKLLEQLHNQQEEIKRLSRELEKQQYQSNLDNFYQSAEKPEQQDVTDSYPTVVAEEKGIKGALKRFFNKIADLFRKKKSPKEVSINPNNVIKSESNNKLQDNPGANTTKDYTVEQTRKGIVIHNPQSLNMDENKDSQTSQSPEASRIEGVDRVNVNQPVQQQPESSQFQHSGVEQTRAGIVIHNPRLRDDGQEL